MLNKFFHFTDDKKVSVALLILRVVAGAAMITHGWGKIQSPFGWMPPEAPIPGFLQFLAALAEFGGGIAWILGLLMPLASVGLVCTMAVAMAFHISMGDPFMKWELATIYLAISIAFIFAGAGRFSLDNKIFRK